MRPKFHRSDSILLGIDIVGAAGPDARCFTVGELDPECRYDFLGDFVLDVEQIVDRAIEALGPQMAAVVGIDQLGRDP